jgi:hypothetical protein
MKKTYYFQHDYEPTSDPKIQYILSVYGGLGYGLWWRIVEMLHSSDIHKIQNKKYVIVGIADQMKCDPEFVNNFINTCVNDVQLLVQDQEYIWSERVMKNIGKMEDISQKRKEAGLLSAQKRQEQATSVEQVLTSVEQIPTKENKIKEKKPTLEDVVRYFTDNGYREELGRRAYDYYEAGEWKDRNGREVKNWKQKMNANWFKDEYKISKNITNFAIPIN